MDAPPPMTDVAERPVELKDWVKEVGGVQSLKSQIEAKKLEKNTSDKLNSLGGEPTLQFVRALVNAFEGRMLLDKEINMLEDAGIMLPGSARGISGRGFAPEDKPGKYTPKQNRDRSDEPEYGPPSRMKPDTSRDSALYGPMKTR